MKKIVVSDECNGCGLCTLTEEFLVEDKTGKAVPLPGKIIKGKDEEKAKTLVKNCPVGALSLTECVAKKSKAAFLEEAENKLKAIKDLDFPDEKQFPFKSSEYSIGYGAIRGEYDYNYSSEERAQRAAEDAFNAAMYSQIKVLLLKVVIQYKNNYMSKYYDLDSDNVYESKVSEIRQTLQDIASEYEIVIGKKLPDDFIKFEKYLDTSRDSWIGLLKRDEIFTETAVNRIKREFESGSYSSISSYRMYWDVDDHEECAGTSLFGNIKYKTTYCYRNIYKACEELEKDLLDSASCADIDEKACETISEIFKQFNNNMHSIINKKIDMLKA